MISKHAVPADHAQGLRETTSTGRDVGDQSTGPASPSDRLRRLVEVGIALSSELSLEALLQKLIETAVELTGARYGALGVIDGLGTGLEQFITVGVDMETQATIGELPHGRGVLGVLIRERRPLRLAELSQDPRSSGFPPGHPAMGSFLGVPILLRGTAFGNLYLTEKAAGKEFSGEDEEIVQLLAAQAAAAIENARLYESSRQWSRQLESLNEVSEALASEAGLPHLLELAASRLRELLDARVVLIELLTPDGASLTIEAASGESASRLIGLKLERSRSKAGGTLLRQRPERIDALIDDPEVDQTAPRLLEATAALYVPLLVRDRPVGVVVAYDKRGPNPRFCDADMRIAQAFANRAALALDLSERVDRETLRALLRGQESERKRLARELHDETLQALAVMRMTLSGAHRNGSIDAYREATAQAIDQISDEVATLRAMITDLRPPALDDLGSEAALEVLVERSARLGIKVRLEVDLNYEQGRAPTRHLPEIEAAIYRIIQEALHNVAKHSGSETALARVTESNAEIEILIQDQGQGFDPTHEADGFGLLGIRERIELLGGTVTITSAPGAGTTVHARIPARRRDP